MAYAPHELVEQWRREAAKRGKTDTVFSQTLAGCLERCAGELEKYHHEDNHGAEWVPEGCSYCDRERAGADGHAS